MKLSLASILAIIALYVTAIPLEDFSPALLQPRLFPETGNGLCTKETGKPGRTELLSVTGPTDR